jgi:hypothetical protein
MYESDLSLLQTIEFVGKMAEELNNSIFGSGGSKPENERNKKGIE